MSFVVNLVIDHSRKNVKEDKGRWIDYLENLTTDLSEIFIDQ